LSRPASALLTLLASDVFTVGDLFTVSVVKGITKREPFTGLADPRSADRLHGCPRELTRVTIGLADDTDPDPAAAIDGPTNNALWILILGHLLRPLLSI